MRWKNNTHYIKNQVFSNDELFEITPQYITRWFCLRVYGTEEPEPYDNPINKRSRGLEYEKKLSVILYQIKLYSGIYNRNKVIPLVRKQ